MIRGAVIALIGLAMPAAAADRVLMLDENDTQVLVRILDAATKAQGIQIAPATAYILDKLNKAPVVTERKDEPADKKEPQQ